MGSANKFQYRFFDRKSHLICEVRKKFPAVGGAHFQDEIQLQSRRVFFLAHQEKPEGVFCVYFAKLSLFSGEKEVFLPVSQSFDHISFSIKVFTVTSTYAH